eukprot:TRINITY_DN1393_c0_g1_i2.p1 TRINITY_DN1393_c0_g1~~TRINITY_DN1393_c0_g1_i2.p1  ORF type:complete len:143 (+),score=27.73 TRINITY_DN1393_c0_g1_i2:432-860(+)
MVILSLIILNENVIDQDTLYDQLKRLGFKEKENHPVFGEWEKLIDKFIKQLYLARKKKESTNQNDKCIYDYMIGSRSKHEIGEVKIRKFIANIFGVEEQQEQQGDDEEEEEEVVLRPSFQGQQSSQGRPHPARGRSQNRRGH